MTTSTVLNPLSAPRFVPFEALKSALSLKTAAVFGLSLATGAYCLYNLYHWRQWQSHPSFLLDNNLKFVKCKCLLAEAQELLKQSADLTAKDLLQQCEALSATLTDKPQQKILLELVRLYAEIAPERATKLATNLTSSTDLYEAAESIREKSPSQEGLIALFQKSLDVCPQIENFSLKFQQLLKLAKAFRALKSPNTAINTARELAEGAGEQLHKVQMYCDIAKCHQEMGDPDQTIPSLFVHASLACVRISGNDELISGHLAIADTCLSCELYEKASNELTEAVKIRTQLHESSPLWATGLTSEIKPRIDLQSKNPAAASPIQMLSSYHNMLMNISHSKWSVEEQIEVYLEFAGAYQALRNSSNSKTTYLDNKWEVVASTVIRGLPQETDQQIFIKARYLKRLACVTTIDSSTSSILLHLKQLYDHSTYDNGFEFGKNEIGLLYLELATKWKQANEASTFFNHYLQCLKQSNKITHLTAQSEFLTKEQKSQMAQAAEELVAKNPSGNSSNLVADLARGYLEIDRLKAHQLITAFENRHAAYFLRMAAIAGAAFGALVLASSVMVHRLLRR